MSKKPDSQKKPAKKVEQEVKKVTAVRAPKLEKVRGPAPASYKARPKVAVENIQKPEIVWNGWEGVTLIKGVKFMVRRIDTAKKQGVPVVFVLDADYDSGLFDLIGSKTYLTVGRVRQAFFGSSLQEGSHGRKAQQCIWGFLDKYFVEEGIKKLQAVRPATTVKRVVKPVSEKLSGEVSGLMDGTFGRYRFEDCSPKAVFLVKEIIHTPKNALKGGMLSRKAVKIQLVSVEPGHPIHGYTRPNTMIFHDELNTGGKREFHGGWAGDQQKMWEYLTDLIAGHCAQGGLNKTGTWRMPFFAEAC